jgi:4-methyl-5(b-hydroxyethyl)-thiazole monophosphate biosynthesis
MKFARIYFQTKLSLYLMKKVFVFLAEGFEETEAIATVDVMIRGGLDVTTVSVTGKLSVTGAHGITVNARALFENADFAKGEMLVLPGGMPGTSNLNMHPDLKKLLKRYATDGKKLAAICAAPLVLGGLDLLHGKKATVYPGFESTLAGADCTPAGVVKDGNIITARGPAFAIAFGLAIVEELQGKVAAQSIAEGLLFQS